MKADEAPKAWKDILNPAYKDGISAKLATSGMQHAQWYMLRKLYGNDFWQEFAKQRPKGFDSRAQLFDRLAKGDDRVCALAEYAGYTLFKEKGAEIDFVAPADGLPGDADLHRRREQGAASGGGEALRGLGAVQARARPCTRTSRSCSTARSARDAPPMGTGKRLADFKLLFPTDWTDYQASHALFVKEWNGIMGL